MLHGPKSHYKSAIAIATPEDGRKAVDMLKSRSGLYQGSVRGAARRLPRHRGRGEEKEHRIRGAIIQLLAKNGVWQCPTLFWERGQWLVDAIDYTKDPDIGYAAKT
jgi:hypothetical protein